MGGQGSPQLNPPPVLVHAHRGGRPENTLPAFEYAIAAGVDAIELDLVVTKDNIVVVSHDPHLPSADGDGAKPGAVIYTLTLAQLHQEVRERDWDTRMPTLDEVFALASKGNFLFNIETKIFGDHPELTPSPEEFVTLVLERIREHRLEPRVILQSFDFRTLQVMKSLAPEIALAALYEGEHKDFTDIAREAGVKIVAPQFNLVTPEQVRAAHAAGLQVMTWTPNTPEDCDRLIAAGVDAIITDDPSALLARLGRTQERKTRL